MKKKHSRTWLYIVISVLLVFALGLIILWKFPLFGKRLPVFKAAGVGESLESTGENQIDDAESSDKDPVDNGGEVLIGSRDDSDQEPLCGGPESMLVLVLVIDANAQADVIRLVRIDFVKPEVLITAIPRDFYVSIVDMAENGITEGRINATYGYGEKFNGSGSGIISLAANLNHNFGVSFDHYIVLNKYKIDKYVDFVDGVDIYLAETVTDGVSTFRAGENHLDGEAATRFLSMRYYDDDFHRIQRQHLFLEAFYEKVINELSVLQQTHLALEILLDKSIQTDYTAQDVYPITCLARTISREDVQFIYIPEDMYHSFTTEGGAAVLIPHDDVAPFLQKVMNGDDSP